MMDIQFKKNYEVLPVYFDFTKDLISNETISSFSITCVDTITGLDTLSIIVDSSSNQSTFIRVVIKGGTVEESHKITIKTVTSFGNSYEKEIIITIINSFEGYFEKQPSEKYLINLEFSNRLALADGDILFAIDAIVMTRKIDKVVLDNMIYTSSIASHSDIQIGVQGGSDGQLYEISAKVISQLGYKYQMDILMMVKDK